MYSTTMACTRVTPREPQDSEGDDIWQMTRMLVDASVTPQQPEHPIAQVTMVTPTMEVVTMSEPVYPEAATNTPRKQPSMGKQPRSHTSIRDAH